MKLFRVVLNVKLCFVQNIPMHSNNTSCSQFCNSLQIKTDLVWYLPNFAF